MMQIALHFIAIRLFILTQDPLILYKVLYLYIFLKSNANPSGFLISLCSLHK
jgi:hypothetical protein